MATWDSADLLDRCKRTAKRPATDAQITDTDWFAWLTEAQSHWLKVIATQAPESQYGAPAILTTSDSGKTYKFPNNDWPVGHIELRQSPTGRLLRPGPEWDAGADYVLDGDTVRFPGGKSKTFTDGPYARYVADPGVVAVATQPVLKPPSGRMLLVYRACVFWASQGGHRDPAPFAKLEAEAWYGDPTRPGDIGLLGTLKNQILFGGAAAYSSDDTAWYQFINDGSGYVVIR